MIKSSPVLELTVGRRVLLLGGQGERPEHRKALEESLQFAELEWITGERNKATNYSRIKSRCRPGRYDYALLLTRFVGHFAMQLVASLKQARIPVIFLPGGYGVQAVGQAILDQCPSLPPLSAPKVEEPVPELDLESFQGAHLTIHKPTGYNNVFLNGFKELQRNGTVTPEIRKRATGWIAEHEEAGFAAFSREFRYKELDHAFWSSIVRTLQHEKTAIEVQKITPTKERVSMPANGLITTERKQVNAYLANMTPEELKNAKRRDYIESTGQDVPSATWSNALFSARTGASRSAAAKKKAGKPSAKVHALAVPGKQSFHVAAEIDLSQFSATPYDTLAKFATLLAESLLQSKVRIVRLADPDAMEVRVMA